MANKTELKPVASIEEEIEKLVQSCLNEMFPRKSFPVTNCDILRNAFHQVRRDAMRECAEIARKNGERANARFVADEDALNPHARYVWQMAEAASIDIASAIEQRMEGQ